MPGSNNIVVTARDLHLLRELSVARILDREQIKLVAGFAATSTVNTRLAKLHCQGLLTRFFIGTKVGGTKALYALSAKGARAAQAPVRLLQRRQDSVLVGDQFVEHQLDINQVWIAAKYRPIPNHELVRWLTFPLVLSKAIPLMPDGYFEVKCSSDVHSLFCEVDRGTESLRVWTKKVELYLALAASGDFQKLFHQSRFKVLVIAPSERRLESLRKATQKLTTKIFRFSTLEDINRDGLFDSIWLTPVGSDKQSLS